MTAERPFPSDRRPPRPDDAGQITATAEILKNLFSVPYPSLAIDIDGCIDEAPIFFKLLTNCWPGKVFAISHRSHRAKAEADLRENDIRYHELILVNTFDAKAEVIERKGVMVYFDDQPEMLKNVPPTVDVMLVRNGGNFDFDEKLWTLSNRTGKLV